MQYGYCSTKQAFRKWTKGCKKVVRNALLVLLSAGFRRSYPHSDSSIYRFFHYLPIPLHTPRGTLGTPVSFALLVRCCGIVFILRKIGTGSSGRVTQVFALSPATRPVPYFKQPSFGFLEPVQEVSRVASQLRVK